MAVALGLASHGCIDNGLEPASTVPPAEAYDAPSRFDGVWLGEADGNVGTLEITPLGPGRYRGLYEGEDIQIEYVLLLEQDMVDAGGQPVPGNRTTFTWQDGRGSRGEGWLLINREDSALSGAFGEQGHMDRRWTFIRVE